MSESTMQIAASAGVREVAAVAPLLSVAAMVLGCLLGCDPVVSVRTRSRGLGPLSEECVRRAVAATLPNATVSTTPATGRFSVVLGDGALAIDLRESSTGEPRVVSNWLQKPGMDRLARFEKLQRAILSAAADACHPGRSYVLSCWSSVTGDREGSCFGL